VVKPGASFQVPLRGTLARPHVGEDGCCDSLSWSSPFDVVVLACRLVQVLLAM